MNKITHNQPLPYPKGIKAHWMLEGNIRQTLLQIRLNLKAVFYSVKPFFVRRLAKKNMRQSGIYSCLFLSIIGSISIANAQFELNGKVFKPGAGIVDTDTWTSMGGNGSGALTASCQQNVCEKDSTGVFVVGRGDLGRTYQMGWESGKYGIVLGKGVVLLLDGHLQSTFQYNRPATKGVTVTFSSSAEPSSTTGLNKLNDGQNYFSAANGGGGTYTTGNPIATGQLTASLWIGPDAGGVYKIPVVGVGPNNNIVSTKIVQNGGEFTVLTPLECVISAPPMVDFGTVNISANTNNQLLSAVQRNVVLNCSSELQDATASATLAWSGTFYGGNNYRLAVSDGSGKALASMRARYVSDSGSCDGDMATELIFNKSKVKEIDIAVGKNEVPITWSLCSLQGVNTGVGTTQVTVDIDWD